MFIEINIDGIVGPTHHFGGLGVGNVASIEHHAQVSHPRQAALEGLQKAHFIASLGIPQFLFLPPVRPQRELLRRMGFDGPIHEQLLAAKQSTPRALSAAFSSAFMWMANAATVTPSCDSPDGTLHCTPANLISSWHRANEAAERGPQLQQLLHRLHPAAAIHDPLPSIVPLRDEGAANHMRLCDTTGTSGFHLFVHGFDEANPHSTTTSFLPRHTAAASQALARLHRLAPERTFYLHQHPRAIDAGVFHNDVIATSCDNLLIHHQFAFLDAEDSLQQLESAFLRTTQTRLQRIVVRDEELPLADAVRSYFFNSQIVRPTNRNTAANRPSYLLVCPHHCQRVETAHRFIQRLIADPSNPIDDVHFVQLEESMANGGGPACLRLRMMLSPKELALLSPEFELTAARFDALTAAIDQFYPQTLTHDDLANADFVSELTRIDEALQLAIQVR